MAPPHRAFSTPSSIHPKPLLQHSLLPSLFTAVNYCPCLMLRIITPASIPTPSTLPDPTPYFLTCAKVNPDLHDLPSSAYKGPLLQQSRRCAHLTVPLRYMVSCCAGGRFLSFVLINFN